MGIKHKVIAGLSVILLGAFTVTGFAVSPPTSESANVQIIGIKGISSTIYQNQQYTATFTLKNLGTTSVDISDLNRKVIVSGSITIAKNPTPPATTPLCHSLSLLTANEQCSLVISITSQRLGAGVINIVSKAAGIDITKNIFVIREAPSSDYMAVRITNDSENSNFKFYLAAQADSNNTRASNLAAVELKNIHFMPIEQIADSGAKYYTGSYDDSTSNTSTAWAKNAEKLASTTDQPSNTIFYIPKGSAGTMYLSYGFAVQDNSNNTGAPSAMNIDSQPPFQEIEYTYIDTADNISQGYWFDLTNINAFALPLSLEGLNLPNGGGATTLPDEYNNEIHGVKQIPYQNYNSPVAILSMQNILTDIKAIFNKPPWSNLIQTDNNNEALRGLVGPATVAANDGPFKNYLKGYITALTLYYSKEECFNNNRCLWINPEYTNPHQGIDCTLVKGYYNTTKKYFEFIPGEGSQKCSFTGLNPFIASPLTNGVGPENALTLTASQVWFLSNSSPEGDSTLELDKQNIYRALYSARVAGFLPGSSPWSRLNPMSLASIGKQVVSHQNDKPHPNNLAKKLSVMYPVLKYDTSKEYYGYYSAVVSKYSNVYSYTFSDFLNQSGLLNVFSKVNKRLQPLTIYITPLGDGTQHPQPPKPPGYNVIMFNHADTGPTYTNSVLATSVALWNGHPLGISSSAEVCNNRFRITTDGLQTLIGAINTVPMPKVSFSEVNLTRTAQDGSQHKYGLSLTSGTLSVTQNDSLIAFEDPGCHIQVSSAPPVGDESPATPYIITIPLADAGGNVIPPGSIAAASKNEIFFDKRTNLAGVSKSIVLDVTQPPAINLQGGNEAYWTLSSPGQAECLIPTDAPLSYSFKDGGTYVLASGGHQFIFEYTGEKLVNKGSNLDGVLDTLEYIPGQILVSKAGDPAAPITQLTLPACTSCGVSTPINVEPCLPSSGSKPGGSAVPVPLSKSVHIIGGAGWASCSGASQALISPILPGGFDFWVEPDGKGKSFSFTLRKGAQSITVTSTADSCQCSGDLCGSDYSKPRLCTLPGGPASD